MKNTIRFSIYLLCLVFVFSQCQNSAAPVADSGNSAGIDQTKLSGQSGVTDSDSEKNKPSYPSILGLDESVKKYEGLYQLALDEIAFLSVDEKPLKDLTFKLMKRSF